ncbi:MAG: RNA-binding S4 domain-containing protein [Hyphomicrobiales bacterium]
MLTRQRIDKWLWFARIAKSRGLAARLVEQGQVRLNRMKIAKPAHEVGEGDVLTLAVHGRVRVLRVRACAPRRGPAAAARHLYDELAMSNSDAYVPQKEDASGGGTC